MSKSESILTYLHDVYSDHNIINILMVLYNPSSKKLVFVPVATCSAKAGAYIYRYKNLGG